VPEARAGFPPGLFPGPFLDFFFLRASENGKPARPPAFVEWSTLAACRMHITNCMGSSSVEPHVKHDELGPHVDVERGVALL
jgi:hypothetical protein